MPRLFFALCPDDLVRRQIVNVMAKLPDTGKKVSPQNLHATLAFLGSIPEDRVECYIEAASQLKVHPFNLLLDTREWWRRSQVTSLGISETPTQLVKLVNDLNKAIEHCGYTPNDRPFRFHVTLMRKMKHPVNPFHFDPIPWLVRNFNLIESHTHPEGVKYRVIQSWDFMG